jgi:hypothetical protein
MKRVSVLPVAVMGFWNSTLAPSIIYDVGVPSVTARAGEVVAPPRSAPGAWLVGCVLLLAALAAAISIDVIPTGYGVKADEATYVGMTLSLAYDHDLTYQRKDLERFWGLYKTGPEGIFLKKGKGGRLYFGKAIVYSLFAAPFVRLLGMNGFLVFNVLLLYAVCVCGYFFLRARSTSAAALTFTLAFVGASVVPVYAVYLMPDLFNLAVVFIAYFFWLYKEVKRPGGDGASGIWSNVFAAVLLGIATYSKPPNAALVAPLVLLPWWRKEWLQGVAIALVFAATTGALFGANAAITGEFNYQGGDRKTFYGSFPFDSTRDVWNQNQNLVATNDADSETVLAASEFAGRLAHNVEYFFVGRHFGLVPYFFPGFLALVAWAFSRDRFLAWRTLTLAALAGATLVWLVIAPYSWSGGGGPVGNRYFLSAYPLLFFLMPPMETGALGVLAWLGGALFTAKILINPFFIAKNTWELSEHGAARRLPVELTMATDLPVMLAQPLRARIHYRNDPLLELFFLDNHAFPPEEVQPGKWSMWVTGAGRADIIVKTEEPVRHFVVTAESPIRTTLTISAGAGRSTIPILPGKPVTFQVPWSGVRGNQSYECLMSAQSSDGFIPHLRDPESKDGRNLGVLLNFKAE